MAKQQTVRLCTASNELKMDSNDRNRTGKVENEALCQKFENILILHLWHFEALSKIEKANVNAAKNDLYLTAIPFFFLSIKKA